MGYQAEEAVKLHWGIPEEYFSTLFRSFCIPQTGHTSCAIKNATPSWPNAYRLVNLLQFLYR